MTLRELDDLRFLGDMRRRREQGQAIYGLCVALLVLCSWMLIAHGSILIALPELQEWSL